MTAMANEIQLEQEPALKEFLLSEGLQFGIGVFETMRLLPSGIEDFHAHLRRMTESGKELEIPIPIAFGDEELLKAYIEAKWLERAEKFKRAEAVELVETDSPKAPISVLKLTLFKQGNSSRWAVTQRSFPYTKQQLEMGFKLVVSPVHRNSTSIIQRHKTLNYAENWMEKQKAIENGYQEVLFLNENLEIAETSASNIFFCKGGRWMTPSLNCGVLEGIMRHRVMAYLSAKGSPVIEGKFFLEDLLQSEQAFLTNALMGVMPIKSIGKANWDIKTTFGIMNYNEIDPIRLLIK